jgi:undecaprenyl-diphosphatase
LNLIESTVLGLIQGLTEFLPISSSGHLVIFERLFHIEAGDLVFEVFVHFGTLIAVLLYFREKLLAVAGSIIISFSRVQKSESDEINIKLFWYLILGTIPAGLIGLLFDDFIELAFASPRWASGMLLVTAAILLSTRWATREDRKLDASRTIIIGCAQALAIMPGISRSGSTISAGMALGMKKTEAAEFSFLLSIPAIFGATIIQIPQFVRDITNADLVINYFVGAMAAAIIGYISIAFLMKIVKKGKFFYFGLYCSVVGILGILLL